jgi:hypothetical protein
MFIGKVNLFFLFRYHYSFPSDRYSFPPLATNYLKLNLTEHETDLLSPILLIVQLHIDFTG